MPNDMRDKIAEIIRNARMFADPLSQVGYAEADALIANGVILPPCWIGDKIYFVCGYNMAEYTIERIEYDLHFWQFHCENPAYSIEHREFSFFDERIGKTVFLTKEDAEKALKEREQK